MEETILLERAGERIPIRLTRAGEAGARQVVLGVHGLGGSSRDPIQAALAEEMALFGCDTLRFDFPAHGENPRRELTLSGCVDTLLAAADYALVCCPQARELCLFATGFGAYVTLVALEQLLERPVAIRLVVQTPGVMMHETILAMCGISRQTLWAMDEVTFPAPRPFTLTYRFYEELENHLALMAQPIPMLILQGEEDRYISMAHIRQFRRLNPDSPLVVIPGASHRFLEAGAWDMVLDLTRDWFECQQVLLTDWS